MSLLRVWGQTPKGLLGERGHISSEFIGSVGLSPPVNVGNKEGQN